MSGTFPPHPFQEEERPDLAMLQAEALLAPGVDKQAWKKQQRMIRNRESAALSRKRKRDRIESLEDQVRKRHVHVRPKKRGAAGRAGMLVVSGKNWQEFVWFVRQLSICSISRLTHKRDAQSQQATASCKLFRFRRI